MQTATTSNMRVIYSTTDKAYLLLSGQTVTGKFPSREDAEVAQLQKQAPEALAIGLSIAEAHPQLRSRVLRAVQLVAMKHVVPARIDGQYRVVSQSGSGEVYAVRLNGSLSCSCFDHQVRAPFVRGARMCKHLLAAAIHRKLNGQAGRCCPTDRLLTSPGHFPGASFVFRSPTRGTKGGFPC